METVKLRITGTKNIAKITKSMKMVSAAKLRGDQQRLSAGNTFSVMFSLLFLAHTFNMFEYYFYFNRHGQQLLLEKKNH